MHQEDLEDHVFRFEKNRLWIGNFCIADFESTKHTAHIDRQMWRWHYYGTNCDALYDHFIRNAVLGNFLPVVRRMKKPQWWKILYFSSSYFRGRVFSAFAHKIASRKKSDSYIASSLLITQCVRACLAHDIYGPLLRAAFKEKLAEIASCYGISVFIVDDPLLFQLIPERVSYIRTVGGISYEESHFCRAHLSQAGVGKEALLPTTSRIVKTFLHGNNQLLSTRYLSSDSRNLYDLDRLQYVPYAVKKKERVIILSLSNPLSTVMIAKCLAHQRRMVQKPFHFETLEGTEKPLCLVLFSTWETIPPESPYDFMSMTSKQVIREYREHVMKIRRQAENRRDIRQDSSVESKELKV